MKTTIIRKLNSLLGIAPAAILLIFAAGNTAPMCGNIEPSMEQVCSSAADCTGLPHTDCDGTWSCENEQCSFTCLPDVPEKELCLVDEQCGKGKHCSLSDGDCQLEVFCPKGEDSGDFCKVECLGECVDDAPDTGCQSDDDCAEGEVCEFVGCADVKCAPDEPCPMMCELEGQCVPEVVPVDCGTDADCPKGMICQIDVVCDPMPCECAEGADCMCASPCFTQGICVPEIPGECNSDKDCPTGYMCVTEVACPACEACDGDMQCGCMEECFESSMCVPVTSPSECESDFDCGPGFACETVCEGFYCPPDTYCGPDSCFGVCVPTTQPDECESDFDCGPGFTCEFLCGGGACPPGAECAPVYCPGVCVPQTEPAGCLEDADCPAGFFCQMYKDDFMCGDGGSGEKCLGAGVCFPIKEPLYCVDDSECPAGMLCSMDPDSFCGGGADGAEQDAMFCMGICTPAVCGEIDCADGYELDPATCKCLPLMSECVIGGCSGELCVASDQPVASPCIWFDYYECFSPALTSCGPFGPGGTCMWEPTAALYDCLEKFF